MCKVGQPWPSRLQRERCQPPPQIAKTIPSAPTEGCLRVGMPLASTEELSEKAEFPLLLGCLLLRQLDQATPRRGRPVAESVGLYPNVSPEWCKFFDDLLQCDESWAFLVPVIAANSLN